MNFFNNRKLVLYIGVFSLLLQVIYLMGSDLKVLNTSWIIDDAYYYLKPAFLFKENFYYTFDGINQTYGFQPLWEIVLTILGFVIYDKLIFVRVVLLFSALIYFFSGLILYDIAQYFYRSVVSPIVPIIWYLNINLIHIFNSGMENIFGGFLFILILYQLKNWDKQNFFILGILTGLLVLTRVNLIFVPVILLMFLIINYEKYLFTIKKSAIFLLSNFLIISPWIIYARNQFGQILPSSGTRKLIGVYSGWINFFDVLIPKKVLEYILDLLPNYERTLYTLKEGITPSIYVLFEYLFVSLPSKAFSFGMRKIYTNSFLYKLEGIKVIIGLVIFSILISLVLYNRRVLLTKLEKIKIKNNISFFVLLVSFINIFINWTFLSHYMQYCIWYGFIEIIGIILIIPYIIKLLFNVDFVKIYKNVILNIIIVGLSVNLIYNLLPNNKYDEQTFLVSSWNAKSWINNNLDNQKIGAFSAGLLGYYVENNTVINLDGLANSPEFVKNRYSNYVLHQKKQTTRNLILEYMYKNKIRYLSDANFIDAMDSFLRFIPQNSYEVIYEGNKLIDWGEEDGKRRYYIIKLKAN